MQVNLVSGQLEVDSLGGSEGPTVKIHHRSQRHQGDDGPLGGVIPWDDG